MKKSEITRLTLSYLGVIMTLSVIFSIIIYMIATAGLNRPLVVGDEERMRAENISFEDHSFEDMFEKRLNRRDKTVTCRL